MIAELTPVAAVFDAVTVPMVAALKVEAPIAVPPIMLAVTLIFPMAVPENVVPPMMLVQNKGACDSKSVTLASLLATLLPGRASVVVLVPEHALLGVALTPAPGERTLFHDGRTYVLMEPVGPAQTPVGQVTERSARALSRLNGATVLPVATAP